MLNPSEPHKSPFSSLRSGFFLAVFVVSYAAESRIKSLKTACESRADPAKHPARDLLRYRDGVFEKSENGLAC